MTWISHGTIDGEGNPAAGRGPSFSVPDPATETGSARIYPLLVLRTSVVNKAPAPWEHVAQRRRSVDRFFTQCLGLHDNFREISDTAGAHLFFTSSLIYSISCRVLLDLLSKETSYARSLCHIPASQTPGLPILSVY